MQVRGEIALKASHPSYEGCGLKSRMVYSLKHLVHRHPSYEGCGLKFQDNRINTDDHVTPRMRGVD